MNFLRRPIQFGILVLCMSQAAPAASARSHARAIEGIVTGVSEGDSITVSAGGREIKARLYAIDAPETQKPDGKNGGVKRGQAFGDASFRALAHKVLHQRVRLESMAFDHNAESVCIVWIGNRNINLEMVVEGWAWFDGRYATGSQAVEYIDAEKRARGKRVGLWIQNNPLPPWEFRKMLKRSDPVRSPHAAGRN